MKFEEWFRKTFSHVDIYYFKGSQTQYDIWKEQLKLTYNRGFSEGRKFEQSLYE